MLYAIPILLALVALETLAVNERPGWFLPFVRLRLSETRRFGLPATRRVVDDAGYRAAALESDERWDRLVPMGIGGLRIFPSAARRAFAVTPDGWRRRYLVRVDVTREGDEVILAASYVPSPLTSVPMLVVAGALIATRIAGGAAPDPRSIGALVGILVGTIAFLSRAKKDADEALPRALDAIEAELTRVAADDRSDAVPAPKMWLGRVLAAAPMIVVAALLTLRSSSEEEAAVRSMVTTFGVTEHEARRLAPHMIEMGEALSRLPDAPRDGEVGAAVVAAGLPRLSDDELAERHAIEMRLASRSPELCAQLGAGRVELRALLSALAAEGDETIRAWNRLSLHAAELELTGAGAPLPDDAEADVAGCLERMIETLPEAEREAFSQRLWPEDDTDDAWCDALHATDEGLARLDAPTRALALRALAAPGSEP